jgi:arylsulfatase
MSNISIRLIPRFLVSIAILLCGVVPTMAQQITSVPGAPDATETIDGQYLPAPPAPFRICISIG